MRRDGWPHHLVLDGAHTADSAAALASAVREAFPNQPLVLVLAMAADKEHREVIAALRGMRPVVVVFTAVPIAGGMQRAAPPGETDGGATCWGAR
jgi:folylpolyglutamate synthase/dihydropteroate synthase